MKKTFLFILVLIYQVFSQNDTLYFAILGQSNAVGYGGSPYTTAETNALEWVGGWSHLEDPLNPAGSASLAPAFCNYLINNYDGTKFYGIVCGAVGAQGIAYGSTSSWSDTSGSIYKNALSKVDSSIGSNSLSAILFIAGEADIAQQLSFNTIRDSTIAMINHFRRDYGGSIPIILSLPCRETYRPWNDTCKLAIRKAIEDSSNIYIWFDNGHRRMIEGEGVHLKKEDLDTLGMSFAQCWMYHVNPFVWSTGIAGRTNYLKFVPKPYMISGDFNNLLFTVDMTDLDTSFWNDIDSAKHIAVYDHIADTTIPRIITNFNKESKIGMLYFSAPINCITKNYFTIEYSQDFDEANDTTALHDAGVKNYWPFDEGSGSICYDLMGKNNGSYGNVTWASGLIDSAAVFNATTSEAHVTGELIGDKDVTMEFSLYIAGKGEPANYERVVDNNEFILNFYWASGNDAFSTMRDGATNVLTYYERDLDNKWMSMMISSNSTGITTLYWDGIWMYDTLKNAGTPATGTTDLYFGNRPANDRTLNGMMQHVVWYSEIKPNPQSWAQARKEMMQRDWFDQEYAAVSIDTVRKKYGYYVEPITVYTCNSGTDTGTVTINSIALDSCNYWTDDSVSMYLNQAQRAWIPKGWYNTIRVITSAGDTAISTYPTRNIRYYVLRPSVVNP